MTRLIRPTRRQFNASLLAAGTLAAGAPFARAEPKRGGTYKLGLRGASTAESFDPATYGTGVINHFMTGAIGNCLTEINERSEVIPELAEEWSASSDAATWTFRLRQDVTFHNGKTVTADDVIASINHHRGEDTKSGGKALVAAVKDIRKDDDRTVIFELEAGNADFPYALAEYFFIIFPADHGKPMWQSGVSCGGYQIVEFEPGVRYVAERFPDYWKDDRAWFDRVEIVPLGDAAARTNALLTGEVDCIGNVDLKTVHLLERNTEVEIDALAGTEHFTMPMFTDTAPFDDVNVRLALKHAVDRQQLVDIVMNGYGQVGNDSPITPANRYFNTEMEQRTYDPEKAKFHLKEAGMDTLKVQLHAADAAFPGAVDSAVLYSEAAAKAGIEIEVVREPDDGYWSNVWLKKPFCTAFWSGRPTEDLMFTTGYAADAAWNDARWKNGWFNDLLVQARTELDTDRRREMYWEMQEIVKDDGGTIIPVYAQHVFAHTKGVAHDALASNRSVDGWKSLERWWRTD